MSHFNDTRIFDHKTGDLTNEVVFEVSISLVGENIYALNASTGAIIWNYPTGGGVWSAPAVSEDTVYVGSGDNILYALNVSTGALKWSYETNGAIYSSPAIADGVVYVGSSDNYIYAIGLTMPATDSGILMNTHYIIIAVVAAVFVGAAVFSLRIRRRPR